jgi:NADPH-dependent glutamate synthase beta subunit-like oxidoreductase/formate hydrogenlyase subunit 6/NADH:ubiquinone oxidoreductase subunit I
MALSMADKSHISQSKGAVVIGSSVAAIQAALTLAQMGVEVKVVTDSAALGWDGASSVPLGDSSLDQRFFWPLLLRAKSHPLITLYTGAKVESVKGDKGDFKIQVVQRPRYIHEDLCVSCGRCQVECSARVTSLLGGQKTTHSAIHTPLLGAKSVPSAYVIDRNGFAPCHVACPLGINVQGFVSLLANGKIDRALALINEVAPLSGILGRVCQHACEDNCSRARVDSPVSIRALHRYVADNAGGSIRYGRKFPPSSWAGRIAIIGSGPAGLTAAWQLARLGYSPTVFESHGVIGGMLATGIPRFRLPREVREREIAAIVKDLGIDIRTGITVGRDVAFAYLKERGYRAFFLSIGAQRNNKLNIPGEELEGVVDCMSLLLTLNLKVDTFVGSNVVVIGDGNSAIDSARAAIRRSKGTVRLLSWTIPEEVTATEEEVKEALQERVSIEYRTVPVEFLGDGRRVTGIRCQRTRLTNEIMGNGRHRPEPIPATDFIIVADQVVVAIGQSPNAGQLNMDALAMDSRTGFIQVNPLTLETSIPGVFAGGDCVTGPNNVVQAVAAGLRAAESIDRYIQGRDLEAGRSLEPPQTAEIDIEAIEVSPYKRAPMPVIRLRKRLNSFEETNVGLSAEAAEREAQRCLNCALCSQCLECARVCDLGAVFYDDSIRRFEVEAEAILSFPSNGARSDTAEDKAGEESTIEGIRIVSPGSNGEPTKGLVEAMVVALETAIEIKPRRPEEAQVRDLTEGDTKPDQSRWISEQTEGRVERTGVFLCHCGGSISAVIDFRTVARRLAGFPGVTCIREISQACTEAGAKEIANQVTVRELDRVVLAACRCCNSEQLCYSCTDRRMMCQYYLNQHLVLPHNTIVEFVNIREQCAWVHKDDPEESTQKAVQIISSGVSRDRVALPTALGGKSILQRALVIGGKLDTITAAKALASRGYQVELLARQGLEQAQHEGSETTARMLELLREKGVMVKPWPDALELRGSPGNYEAVVQFGSQVDCVTAGAVLVDVEEVNKGVSPLLNTSSGSVLLRRIMSRTENSGYLAGVGADLLREVTIKETSGIFLLPPDGAELAKDQILRGLAVAARVSAYLDQESISPRATAVDIDSRLCRGCGNCAAICPYIEMRQHGDGTVYAYVDRALCLGCGACITSCPTGAITQHVQSDKQIISTLRCMLRPG